MIYGGILVRNSALYRAIPPLEGENMTKTER